MISIAIQINIEKLTFNRQTNTMGVEYFCIAFLSFNLESLSFKFIPYYISVLKLFKIVKKKKK